MLEIASTPVLPIPVTTYMYAYFHGSNEYRVTRVRKYAVELVSKPVTSRFKFQAIYCANKVHTHVVYAQSNSCQALAVSESIPPAIRDKDSDGADQD